MKEKAEANPDWAGITRIDNFRSYEEYLKSQGLRRHIRETGLRLPTVVLPKKRAESDSAREARGINAFALAIGLLALGMIAFAIAGRISGATRLAAIYDGRDAIETVKALVSGRYAPTDAYFGWLATCGVALDAAFGLALFSRLRERTNGFMAVCVGAGCLAMCCAAIYEIVKGRAYSVGATAMLSVLMLIALVASAIASGRGDKGKKCERRK